MAAPLVEFMYLVFTRMSGESYRRRKGCRQHFEDVPLVVFVVAWVLLKKLI